MLGSNVLTVTTRMLLPKQMRTFPHDMQQPGSALLTSPEELTYLLHATLPRPRANLSKEKGIRIENQQERRE